MRTASLVLGVAGALSLACGGARSDGAGDESVAPASAGPQTPAVTSIGAPATGAVGARPTPQACAIEPVVRAQLDIRAATAIGEVAGKRWIVATLESEGGGERRAALLHLDRRGALIQTPLPWWSEDVAIERGPTPGLRFVDATAPRWFAVDLRDPDAPVVGDVQAIPGLVPGEHPKGIGSDGRRALVSLYRRAPAGSKPRYIGETFLLDVATGAKIGAPAPATVWSASCADGRCYGLAEANRDPQPSVLVALDDAGYRELSDIGPWRCGGAEDWRVGDEWRLAWSERGKIGLAALDLRSGDVRTGALELGGDDCVSAAAAVDLGGARGLIITRDRGTSSPGTSELIVLDEGRGGLVGGDPQALPAMSFSSQAFAPVGDAGWLLGIDYRAASGMIHGPPDADGSYEYHESWDFSGRLGLLARDDSGGDWGWLREAPLPHSGDSGDFSDGYRPRLLTGPGSGGVLLVGDGMASEYVAAVEPCPAGS